MENSYPAMLLQLAIYTYTASVVCSVKCIGSSFRLLVAVHTNIKANKICSGMKVGSLR